MIREPLFNSCSHNAAASLTTLIAKRFLISLCVAFFLSLAWSQSERGVDQRFYLRWNDAAVTGDVEQLGSGLRRSVCGVPFFHWQAGTGLIAFPARRAAQALGHGDQAIQLTGLLCAGLFWWTFWWAVRELSDPPRAWFGCALAAVATPLGYYSLSISSEAVSLFPLGVLFLQFCRGLRGRPVSAVAVSTATTLMMTVRSYLGVYAWPAMFVAVVQSARQGRGRLAATLAVLAAGAGLAMLQIAIVNVWMTGSPWHSAYVFGDAQFSSLDWTCPHGHRVLLETFHGLFPTHPFLLVGLLALTVLAIRPPGTVAGDGKTETSGERPAATAATERVAWGIVLCAVAVHVYFQGCWYCWWVAEISFGMRGLVAVSVPAVLALMRLAAIGRFPHVARSLRDRNRVSERRGHVRCADEDLPRRPPRIVRALLPFVMAPALASAVWSWLLWLQGPMDYLDWGSMWEGQWLRIQMWTDLEMIGIFIAGVIVMAVFWWACLLLSASLLAFSHLAWHTHRRLERPAGGFATFNADDAAAAYKTLSQIPRFAPQRDSLRGYLARTMGEAWCRDLDRIVEDGEEIHHVKTQGTRSRMRNSRKDRRDSAIVLTA